MKVTDEIRQEMGRIYGRDGVLTPSAVVEAAKDKCSPLHECFPWDDKQAAHSYRLELARSLIRAVPIEREIVDREARVPQYVRDQSLPADQPGYASMDDIRRSKTRRTATLRYEYHMLLADMRRVLNIAEDLGEDTSQLRMAIEIVRRLQDGGAGDPPAAGTQEVPVKACAETVRRAEAVDTAGGKREVRA